MSWATLLIEMGYEFFFNILYMYIVLLLKCKVYEYFQPRFKKKYCCCICVFYSTNRRLYTVGLNLQDLGMDNSIIYTLGYCYLEMLSQLNVPLKTFISQTKQRINSPDSWVCHLASSYTIRCVSSVNIGHCNCLILSANYQQLV